MTRGNFGIDMVSGSASDFRLESVQGWSIKPGNRVGEDNEPWGVCVDGSYLSGSGYYINAGKQGELSGRIDLTKRGLTYTYNPSTLEHPSPYQSQEPHLNFRLPVKSSFLPSRRRSSLA